MSLPTKSQISATKRRLKIALAQKGWSEVDLAAATGRAVQTIRNVVAGNSPSAPTRALIEHELGVPIWSDLPDGELLEPTSPHENEK